MCKFVARLLVLFPNMCKERYERTSGEWRWHTYVIYNDESDESIVNHAVKKNNVDVVKYMHRYGRYIPKALHLGFACCTGSFEVVKYLHENGIELMPFVIAMPMAAPICEYDDGYFNILKYFLQNNLSGTAIEMMLSLCIKQGLHKFVTHILQTYDKFEYAYTCASKHNDIMIPFIQTLENKRFE